MHANVLDVDITPATAIFVYLVPEGMSAMRAVLEDAMDSRGVRVVTYGILVGTDCVLLMFCPHFFVDFPLAVFSIPDRPPLEVSEEMKLPSVHPSVSFHVPRFSFSRT